jgi:polyphosphate kinase
MRMRAVLRLAACELRGRWLSWAVLVLLVGLAGGVVLTAVAGAQRTDSAYPRFLAVYRASDVLVSPADSGVGGYDDALARLPSVAAIAPLVGLQALPLEPGGRLDAAAVVALRPRYRRATGGQIFVADEATQAATVERSIRPQAVALALFALVLAVTALLIVGQVASRQLVAAARDNPTLAALGLTRRRAAARTAARGHRVAGRGHDRARLADRPAARGGRRALGVEPVRRPGRPPRGRHHARVAAADGAGGDPGRDRDHASGRPAMRPPQPGNGTALRVAGGASMESATAGGAAVAGKSGVAGKDGRTKAAAKREPVRRLDRALYEKELYRLQGELMKVQEWVRAERARIVVIFEGRDAAGKGGAIKRVTQYLNPRVARIAALPAPTGREQGQWYFQRYVDQLPTAGEVLLFDRSWYNRAGVEHVMGFCTKEEYHRFLHQCPIFERLLVEDGILLRKYWFSVSDEEQQHRFRGRLDDPMRRWKLSPMDLESITRWEDYSRAKDEMFVHTDIPEAPWYVVESEDKRSARINMISHLLSTIPYHDVQPAPIKLPPRPPSQGYVRVPREMQTYVPDHAASLT